MNIMSIGLNNFTVFTNFQLDVSSGINIFLGENGTGKTHLLKAIYAACEISKNNSLGADFLERCFKKYGSVNLIKDDKNGELDIYLKADCDNKEYIAVKLVVPVVISTGVDNSLDEVEHNSEAYHIHLQKDVVFDATFIPCKDMLTHANGLPAMTEKFKAPFDKTLTNIITTKKI